MEKGLNHVNVGDQVSGYFDIESSSLDTIQNQVEKIKLLIRISHQFDVKLRLDGLGSSEGEIFHFRIEDQVIVVVDVLLRVDILVD